MRNKSEVFTAAYIAMIVCRCVSVCVCVCVSVCLSVSMSAFVHVRMCSIGGASSLPKTLLDSSRSSLYVCTGVA